MTKDYNLTIGERVAATNLFNEFKGKLSEMAAIIDDVKGFAVEQAEWDKAKLVKRPNPDGTERWQWEDEGSEKSVSLSDPSRDYLTSKIKSKSEAGELTLADKPLITLQQKLQ